MKNFNLSIATLLALSSFANAGGDLAPVTPYQSQDQVVAEYEYEHTYVAPVPEPIIEKYVPIEEPPMIEKEYIAPAPVYVEPEIVEVEPEPIYTEPEIIEVEPEPIYTESEIVEEYIPPKPIKQEPIYVEPTPQPVKQEPIYIEPTPQPVVIAPIPARPTHIVKPKNISPSGFYAGLGITGVKYKDSCKCKNGKGSNKFKDTTYGVMARVGYDINQYIGVEARGSKTNWDSHGSKVEHGGIYAKPMIPVGNATNVYGLVGLAKTKVKSNSGKTPKVNADGLALGIGVEMDLSKDIPKDGRYSRSFDGQGDQEKGLGLFVDYERMLVKKNAPDLDAVSAGVTYDF